MNSDFSKTILSQTLDLDLSINEIKTENLSTLCTDLFQIIINMRDTQDLGETAALRKLVIYYIAQFEKNCIIAGFTPDIISYAKYALVAILDETVLSIPGEARDFWITNPLQLEIFGESIAGVEFYNKLDNLLVNPEKFKDVLEIYFICLCLGFKGKYFLENQQKRESVISKLANTIVKNGETPDILSPDGNSYTPGKRILNIKKPVVIPLWVTFGILASIAFALWAILYFLSGNF